MANNNKSQKYFPDNSILLDMRQYSDNLREFDQSGSLAQLK
jgi:hypothetical protein